MGKVAIYLRRSSDRQERSLEEQREYLAKHAKKVGHQIVHEYVDDALSGASSENRPDFLKMIDDALDKKNRAFNVILTYDISRFGRTDIMEAGYYIHLLREAGVRVEFATEDMPIDGVGQMVFAARQFQKHETLRQISRDTLRGLADRARRGCWTGGPPPFGYDLVICEQDGTPVKRIRPIVLCGCSKNDRTENIYHELTLEGEFIREIRSPRGTALQLKLGNQSSKLVPGDPERIKTVNMIFDLYANKGLGYGRIAGELNDRARENSTGGPWTTANLRSLVVNPTYIGILTWNRRSKSKFFTLTQDGFESRAHESRNTRVTNDEDDWIVAEVAELAIVPKKLWNKAEKARLARSRKGMNEQTMGYVDAGYILSGVGYCGDCEEHLYGMRRRSEAVGHEDEFYRWYGCSTYNRTGGTACHRNAVDADKLEAFVMRHIRGDVVKYVDKDVIRDKVKAEIKRAWKKTEPQARSRGDLPKDPETEALIEEIEAIRQVPMAARKTLKLDGKLKRLEGELKARNASQTKGRPRRGKPDWDALVDKGMGYLDVLNSPETFPANVRRKLVEEFVVGIRLNFKHEKKPTGRYLSRLTGGELRLRSFPQIGSDDGSVSGSHGCPSKRVPDLAHQLLTLLIRPQILELHNVPPFLSSHHGSSPQRQSRVARRKEDARSTSHGLRGSESLVWWEKEGGLYGQRITVCGPTDFGLSDIGPTEIGPRFPVTV